MLVASKHRPHDAPPIKRHAERRPLLKAMACETCNAERYTWQVREPPVERVRARSPRHHAARSVASRVLDVERWRSRRRTYDESRRGLADRDASGAARRRPIRRAGDRRAREPRVRARVLAHPRPAVASCRGLSRDHRPFTRHACRDAARRRRWNGARAVRRRMRQATGKPGARPTRRSSEGAGARDRNDARSCSRAARSPGRLRRDRAPLWTRARPRSVLQVTRFRVGRRTLRVEVRFASSVHAGNAPAQTRVGSSPMSKRAYLA